MNPIRDFVVRVPSAFKDTVDMGGTELYLDTRFNPDDLQIQYGEIVSVPLKWDLGARPGDTLFFHHHVTTNESLHLEGDDYMVIYDLGLNGLNNQAIAYRSKETGELHALGEWVLTEPVDNPKAQETTTSFGIILPPSDSEPKYRTDVCRIVATNPELEEMGLATGDIVHFDNYSNYKLELEDGRDVFRMRARNLTAKEL